MQNRIVLVSDDSDFFEYITLKIKLRKNDELYRFGFDDVLKHAEIFSESLFIINCEKCETKSMELVELIQTSAFIIFSYNDNEILRTKCYKYGMAGYLTPFVSEEEFDSIIMSGLLHLGKIKKTILYRKILEEKNLIADSNEVYKNYNEIIEKELLSIKKTASNSILIAIAPNDKTKFLLKPEKIETIILNNIRHDDILMSYASNKYFLILHDSNIENAKKIWEKIEKLFPEKIYAGFANSAGITSRGRWVDEALNQLHKSINVDYTSKSKIESLNQNSANFKLYRQEFNKNIEKIITPVFYHVEQTYGEKLYGVTITHNFDKGSGEMSIRGKYVNAFFNVTSPGFSKINIDIIYKKTDKKSSISTPSPKRITLEPSELEFGVLADLAEQFILEYKQEVINEHT